MANTRQSSKRARQTERRRERNQIIRGASRTVLKRALEAIQGKNPEQAKAAYQAAVQTLSKAASKGCIPKGRASRKISRMTLLAKKMVPEILPQSARK